LFTLLISPIYLLVTSGDATRFDERRNLDPTTPIAVVDDRNHGRQLTADQDCEASHAGDGALVGICDLSPQVGRREAEATGTAAGCG
jgi:hypothetical protein